MTTERQHITNKYASLGLVKIIEHERMCNKNPMVKCLFGNMRIIFVRSTSFEFWNEGMLSVTLAGG